MKKLPIALKEILESAEQEDRDELASILNCYGNPANAVLPAIWCLSRAVAVKRLVDSLGVSGVRFTTDGGAEAMVFDDSAAMQNFVDVIRMSGEVYKAMMSGGLDAVASIQIADEAPPQTPPPACPELTPEGIRSRLLSVFTAFRTRLAPDDVDDVHAALAWCEAGSSVLPPIWALERLGMAVSDDRGKPYTAVGHARGCLVRHLRVEESVPGPNLMLASCPHDLYTMPAGDGDGANPLVGYLYPCAAAAKDLLPDAKALLALDSCPLNLPEGKELDAMKTIVQNQQTMWARLLGRVSKALWLDVTGFLGRHAAYGTFQPSTLHVASPAAPSSPCGPESKSLAMKAAALLVGIVLHPCREPDRPVAHVQTSPDGWTPKTPMQLADGDAAVGENEALRLWFAETHALDEPATPPAGLDDDADAVLETDNPRWSDGRAAAFYGAVVSLLFAYGSVAPKLREGAAKRLRPDAVVTAAHVSVSKNGAGDDPGALSLELVVETNVNAKVYRDSAPNIADFRENMATAFLLAFFGGAETCEEILRHISCMRIPCDRTVWSAVEQCIDSDVAGELFGVATDAMSMTTGNASHLRNYVRVERGEDADGRLVVKFSVKGGRLGDLLVALAAARRGRPFMTEGLVRAAAAGPSLFVPTGRGGYADAARYAAVASRITPAHRAAVVPLDRAPRGGLVHRACVQSGVKLTVGADAEHDRLDIGG